MKEFIRLNLGCGNLKLPGYVNIDISEECHPDLVQDITKGFNLPQSWEVEEINAGCVLEQLDNREFLFVANECWRVLKDGGELKGYVPSTDPRVLHLDPMDKMFFQEASFNYLNKNHDWYKNFGRNYGFQGWSETEAKVNENGIIFFRLKK